MISKVGKKFYLVVVMAVSLWVLSPLGRVTGMDVLGGSLIPATPFDRQLTRAGGFQAHFEVLSGSLQSSEGLFIQAHSMRYIADPSRRDTWQTPEETQARWAGDCEDKALWLFANLKKNGYSNVRLVVGRYRSTDRNYHVWVTMADGQGNVFILDPTIQKKIWRNSDFGEGTYRALYSFDGMNRYRHNAS